MPKPLTVWITINCEKFWKRWEYHTTWPASGETYMQVRKQHGTTDLFQMGKGVLQGCILSPCLFNLYAEYIIREGNGTPLQYSCLENPMDGGAWWAESMGLRRVGHDWVTSLSFFAFMHWRRKWQPTPVFLPGESQGRGSLVGCCLWGCTESDTTQAT